MSGGSLVSFQYLYKLKHGAPGSEGVPTFLSSRLFSCEWFGGDSRTCTSLRSLLISGELVEGSAECVSVFLFLESHRRSSTGQVSWSIRSHVACVSSHTTQKTSETPEGRSATFRVLGLVFFCGGTPWRPLFFCFLSFFDFSHFSCFLRFFSFFPKGSLHSGRSKVTRGTVGPDIHQPTNQSFGVCEVNLA